MYNEKDHDVHRSRKRKEKTMRRMLRVLTALVLVFGMAFNQPLSVMAGQNTYISDIKIGYGYKGGGGLAQSRLYGL